MGQRQLASVLFAAVGVFVAASRLPEIFFHIALLAQWTPTIEDPADPVSQRLITTIAFVNSLLGVLVGTVLVLLRDRLAGHLFPVDSKPIETRDFQAVALSVLGCYFAVRGVSSILWPGQLDWGAVAQVVLGVALFFGARGLSRLWSLSRSADRSRGADERAV